MILMEVVVDSFLLGGVVSNVHLCDVIANKSSLFNNAIIEL